MRAIDPAVSGLRVERASCSPGDGQCRFTVLEADDPRAGYIGKIEQRFAGKRDPG